MINIPEAIKQTLAAEQSSEQSHKTSLQWCSSTNSFQAIFSNSLRPELDDLDSRSERSRNFKLNSPFTVTMSSQSSTLILETQLNNTILSRNEP